MSPRDLTAAPSPGSGLAAIAGMVRAERLFRRIDQDPFAETGVGILGPGGCGKSALLAALTIAYRAAGVRVVGAEALSADGALPADAVLVLDDAHDLEPAVLQRAADAAAQPGSRVVVAFRPWPRPAALTALASVLRQRNPFTVLQHLEPDEIAYRVKVLAPELRSDAAIELLSVQSGGHPLLLDETLAALADAAPLPEGTARLPRELFDRLRFVVDDLDPDTRALLHAIAAGAGVQTAVLAALLERAPAAIRASIEQARATGYLLGDGRLIPVFQRAMLAAEPIERTRELQVALLDIHVEHGHELLALARELARGKVRSSRAATLLVDAADAELPVDPAAAAALYADAIATGHPPAPLAARRAEAAAVTGQLDLALQLADPILTQPDSPELGRAIDVVAAVLAHRGELGRAAELYGWLGPERIGGAAPLAALAFLATGAPDAAEAMSQAARARRAPTMLAAATGLMLEGVQSSLSGSAAGALSALSRASSALEPIGRTALLTDTPSALTALVAVHVGEFEVGAAALRRAIAQDIGGALAGPRQRLLLAWIEMLRGRPSAARALVRDALVIEAAPHPRDELFLRALEVGLARRGEDGPALARAWDAAHQVLLRQPIDLFALLPLAECVIAAARLGEADRLAPQLARAAELLAALGEPELWATALHWACVQAAVELPSEAEAQWTPDGSALNVEAHRAALSAAGRRSQYGRVLAAAGELWTALAAGPVSADAAQAAAAGLHGVGLGWDGSRLLAHAAERCSDRRAAAALLQAARVMHDTSTSASGPTAGSAAASAGANGAPGAGLVGQAETERPGTRSIAHGSPSAGAAPVGVLSDRELEVAELLLRNQTYREIGQRLFISPKTVEHHVARMKQRIGASGRSELFAELRAITASVGRTP